MSNRSMKIVQLALQNGIIDEEETTTGTNIGYSVLPEIESSNVADSDILNNLDIDIADDSGTVDFK